MTLISEPLQPGICNLVHRKIRKIRKMINSIWNFVYMPKIANVGAMRNVDGASDKFDVIKIYTSESYAQE